MGKFLKKAFFLRLPMGALGLVPLNLVGLAACALLGLGHPGFWLLGAAAEGCYLLSLTSSARFRRYVTGMELAQAEGIVEEKRRGLVRQLDPAAQTRVATLERRCARVLELYEGQGVESYITDSSREALHRLNWMFLKLLLARNYLKSQESLITQEKLSQDLTVLERQLGSGKLTDAMRESKTATRDILCRRLQNLERREQSLDEIDSDLQRIEAQVELAVDEAALKGQPHAVSASIDLVTQLLDIGNYADTQAMTVQELEDSYKSPPARRLISSPATPASSPPQATEKERATE